MITEDRIAAKDKVRKALDAIDEILSGKDSFAATYMWDVLSALRGPDVDDQGLKDATTSVIRAAAFPKTSILSTMHGGRVGASMAPDTDAKANLRAGLATTQINHFMFHANVAFSVLGLKWKEKNEGLKNASNS